MSKQHKAVNQMEVDEKSTNKKSNYKSEFPKSLKKKEAISSVSKESNKAVQEVAIDLNGETTDEKNKVEATSIEKPSKRSELQFKQEVSQKSKVQETEKNEKNNTIQKTVYDSAQIKEGHNNVESNVTEFSSIRPNSQALESANQIKKAATESKRTKNSVSGTKKSKTSMKNEEKSSIAALSNKQSKKQQILDQNKQILPSEKQCDINMKKKEPQNCNETSNEQEQPTKSNQGELYVPPLGKIENKKPSMTMRSAKRAKPIETEKEDDEAQVEYKKKIQKTSNAKSSKKLPVKSEKSEVGKSVQKQSKSVIKSMKKVKVNPIDAASEKK